MIIKYQRVRISRKLICSTFFFFFFIIGIHAQSLVGTYDELSDSILSAAAASDIICIGEESHGDMKAHAMKARILRDVVEREPVGAILFEAPLVASVMAYLKDASYVHFVWPFWKYDELRESLNSIIGAPGVICLGFDPQETCDFIKFSAFLMAEGYLKQDSHLAEMDSLLSIAISVGTSGKTRSLSREEAKEVERLVAEIRLELSSLDHETPFHEDLINLCLDNRIFLAKEMTYGNMNDRVNYRDSIMALNIRHIDEIFGVSKPDKKTVIWAANLHIAKGQKSGKPVFMMERYVRDNPERVLSIGLIPRKRKREFKKYDFTVISGAPQYMGAELMKNYECK